jgi:hypothetical protein
MALLGLRNTCACKKSKIYPTKYVFTAACLFHGVKNGSVTGSKSATVQSGAAVRQAPLPPTQHLHKQAIQNYQRSTKKPLNEHSRALVSW